MTVSSHCLGAALAAVLLVALPLRAAEPAKDKPAEGDKYQWKAMFDGKSLKGWKVPEFGGEGKVTVKDGAIHIERGDSMSGIAATFDVPTNDYEVAIEAKRVDGNDFFCTTTFPVEKSFCSFVVGGWGGTVVGLSSIDGYDASDNQTNRIKDFKNNQWYRVRVRVTQAKIECWIDDEQIVDFTRKDHKISIRWECEACRPLGIATWCTGAAVRDVRIRHLKPEEVKEIAESAEK